LRPKIQRTGFQRRTPKAYRPSVVPKARVTMIRYLARIGSDQPTTKKPMTRITGWCRT
jgi:hypothetical protein